MKDVEIIGMLKSYINKTLVGMGALKGASCQIKSIVKTGNLNTVTFVWTDTEGTSTESTMLVYDGAEGAQGPQGLPGEKGEPGAPGTNGTDGADGFSPTITVKESTAERYVLTITDASGSYDTPNLKGSGGGGGASALSDLTDVQLQSLANGNALIYDSTLGKWANVALAAVATSGSYNDLTDKPSIPAAQVQSDWSEADSTKADYIKNKPTLAAVATSGDYDDLSNKPTIPAAQVNADWNAASGVAQILNKPTLGTAAAKDSTNAVTSDNTDLVTSGAVYTAIDNGRGDVTEAQYSAIASILS